MGDYYDELEAQLAALTARGAHRRRLASLAFVARIRAGGLAVALTVAIVLVIAVVFLSAGKHSPLASSPRPVGRHGSGGTTSHHVSTVSVPPPRGNVVCQTNLRLPNETSNPRGIARIYEQGVGRFVLWAIVSGVGPAAKRERYAVWLANGPGKARRIGFAYHPGGSSSELAAQLPLPDGAASYHTVVITREPRDLPPNAPATAPLGQIVLEGPISF